MDQAGGLMAAACYPLKLGAQGGAPLTEETQPHPAKLEAEHLLTDDVVSAKRRTAACDN